MPICSPRELERRPLPQRGMRTNSIVILPPGFRPDGGHGTVAGVLAVEDEFRYREQFPVGMERSGCRCALLQGEGLSDAQPREGEFHGNTMDLGGTTRQITLGSSGSMTFGGVISNGALTLTRNADGANGWFALSGANTFAGDLTLDGVRVNASGDNAVLGVGGVILGGTTGYDTTLNINDALILANAATFADVVGVKSITNNLADATIQGLVTNSDNTGTIQIGSGDSRTFTLAGGLGGSGSTDWFFGGTGLPGTIVISSSSASTGTGDTTIDGAAVTLEG